MRLDSLGNAAAGKGLNQFVIWLRSESAPRVLGAGAGRGWANGAVYGAGPATVMEQSGWAVLTAQAPDWRLGVVKWGNATVVCAGGPYVVSYADGVSSLDVPPGYETWTIEDIGRDGTRIFRLNNDKAVIWPDGAEEIFQAEYVRWSDADLLACANGNQPFIRFKGGAIVHTAMLEPTAYAFHVIDGGWALYHAPSYGLVIHPLNDPSQGYQWQGTEFNAPDAVTTENGETVIVWSPGIAELASEIRREVIRLGVGMQPFQKIETPVTVPTFKKLPHFAYTVSLGQPDPQWVITGADDPNLGDPNVRGILFTIAHDTNWTHVCNRARQFGLPVYAYRDYHTFTVNEVPSAAGVIVVPTIQAYPWPGETEADTRARVRAMLVEFTEKFSRVAIMSPSYRQWNGSTYALTEQQVIDRMAANHADVAEFKLFAEILFEWNRANGQDGAVASDALMQGTLQILSSASGSETWPLTNPTPKPDPVPAPIQDPPDTEEPMRKPESKDPYIDKIADAVALHAKMDRATARQGVLQNWDKHERLQDKGLAWCGYSLAQGAFCRDGGNSVLVKATILDQIADDCAAIDLVFLR